MWGDYGVIMGNSGGDNRVEFGTRVSHAIWYELPTFGGGFQFNVMFSPGQNRADDSSNLASGESDCAGNNDPNSGANPLASCSDGAFSNAVSANLSYTNGPFYVSRRLRIPPERQPVERRRRRVRAWPARASRAIPAIGAAEPRLASNSATRTPRTKTL